MTAQHVLKKFARRLHRNLFLSVPNSGSEIDLSRLRPAQNATLEMPTFTMPAFTMPAFTMPAFTMQFAEQTLIASSRFAPEPWDLNQDR